MYDQFRDTSKDSKYYLERFIVKLILRFKKNTSQFSQNN